MEKNQVESLTKLVTEYAAQTGRDVEEVINFIARNFIVANDHSFISFAVPNGRDAVIFHGYVKEGHEDELVKLVGELENKLGEIGITRILAAVDNNNAREISRLFPSYHRISTIFSKELINDGEPVLD